MENPHIERAPANIWLNKHSRAGYKGCPLAWELGEVMTRPRSKILTLRRLMSYIYGAPILDVSRSHTTTQHSR